MMKGETGGNMIILVLNFRIHSVEYEVFSMPEEKELCSGIIEKIGLESSVITHKHFQKQLEKFVKPVLDHIRALEVILSILKDPVCGVIKDTNQIDAIGHRIVHGEEKYYQSVLIDENVKKEIYKCFELAPLHNPYNFKGIEATEKYLQNKPQVAVFDTSFHHSMPEFAYRYPIPEKLYQQYRIRKYGFHGISHKYVAEQTAHLLKKPTEKVNLISLHLGEGASLCAVKNGISIDTSMGFTPLEGLMMTTRSGDISPDVIFFLQKSGWTLNSVESCLNNESGILGISGISDRVTEVVSEMEKGDKRALLAIDMFVYRVRKYLGAYYLLLCADKLDAISFTGGIGKNSSLIRKLICQNLECLGIELDENKNEEIVKNKEGEISSSNSKIKIFVIPRNEKLVIAREVYGIITKKS